MQYEYQVSIQEVGKQKADAFVLSEEEHQLLIKAKQKDEWFDVEIDGIIFFYNMPMLSSITIKKLSVGTE